MRVRILYTNGKKTFDFIWIRHRGEDVYCGLTGTNSYRSYHKSGKVHITNTDSSREYEIWHTPLAEVKQFNLMTFAFTNSEDWFSQEVTIKEYAGKESDAILVIDGRSIPKDKTINVSIGIVEPDNIEVLKSMILRPQQLGIEPKQLLLSTSVKPWVYAILYSVDDIQKIEDNSNARTT